jgi:hypothetical protein
VGDPDRRHGIAARTVSSWVTKARRDPSGQFGEFVAALDAVQERRLHLSDDERPIRSIEAQAIVWRAVEAGSVQAAKLYWQMLQRQEEREPKPDPFADLLRSI